MKYRKERLTVSVDRDLLRAGHRAVAAGMAASLSGWVNLALAERAAKERRLEAMGAAVAAYEARFGEISAEEIAEQAREDRRNSVSVGPLRHTKKRSKRSAA